MIKRLVAIYTCILSLCFASDALAEEPEPVGALFSEQWTTNGSLTDLGNALTRNQELGAHPEVDALKLRNCLLPVQESFHKSLMIVFGPAISGSVGQPEGYESEFRGAYDEWRSTVDDFVEYIRTLPVAINIKVTEDKVQYLNIPTLPALYAHVPFQTLVLILEGEEAEKIPRFREEIV